MVLVSYIMTAILSGFLHFILAEPVDYLILFASILLISLGHFFVVIGLIIGEAIPFLKENSAISSYKTHLTYLITCSVLYVIITNAIDIHQLGDMAKNSNPPFVEGVSELISRYLLPACGYVSIIYGFFRKEIGGKFRFIFVYIFPLIVAYSVYVDLFIKLSKQVVITWILVFIFANAKTKFMKMRHALALTLVALTAFSYITFNRILSYDELGSVGFLDKDGPISFVAEVIYHRLVGVYELSNLLKSGVDLYAFNLSVGNKHSIANFYTNAVYGFPVDGGSSSAPGFVGYFLYCFGYIGIVGSILVGFFCSAVYKSLCAFGDIEYAKIIASLLLFLLMVDGILDERLFSSFPIKLIILHSVVLVISRIRLPKRVCFTGH